MAPKKKPRGRRVPCPDWWLDLVHEKLDQAKLTKKKLSQLLVSAGKPISEMMVIRCLHDEAKKRVPTIEAIDAISDYFKIPRPVVIAANQLQAIAIHGALRLAEADADRSKI